ncbi:hypothetical protein [Acidisphaera rubrifaciens]|uniref:Uncharacterized protein n=1 Tax=Acidisphaera rubrifaciens HS-AP3 TaxID=1231350 RepID=A0A0D6P9I3_9PROT|nr:hypothetical protein [Acidisphaera rubrifaciens]GAN77853.1 hypothetical protein Asru_0485_02 [Acidisphaera rubrifaciens HS-AP3]
MRQAAGLAAIAAAVAAVVGVAVTPARAGEVYRPQAVRLLAHGNLLIGSSVYAGNAGTITVGQALPVAGGVAAVADGAYPGVFANDSVDGNFGITAPLLLSGYKTFNFGGEIVVGRPLGTLDITRTLGVTSSFSSKSELSLNVATDGQSVSFMGYRAPANTLDVSNSNTPGVVDPTNTDIQTPTFRAIVDVNRYGFLGATETSAYSGNNGRAAILSVNTNGTAGDLFMMAGNAGNGSGIPPTALVADTGVQLIRPGAASPVSTVVGMQQGTPGQKDGFQYGFSVANPPVSAPADKSGKDDNFRAVAVSGNTLYVAKGSGGNGVNTVYQVSVPGGGLPTPATAAQASITILPGFPSVPEKAVTDATTDYYPFGLYFANATTLYVADEGPQQAAPGPHAGLQKWVFNGTTWTLAYTLQAGLNLGTQYMVPRYPAQYAPATTGLRNLAGYTQGNTVTLFATTATYSTLPDPGADPNQVVEIVDQLDATTPPANAQFFTVAAPRYGTVYRGVAYIP